MMRLVTSLVATCLMLGTPGQPTGCVDDSQCTSGYYCATEVHACRECLHCGDLNRESPYDSCVRSVSKCGPCLKGLVDDPLGELGTRCVEPQSNDGALPAYVIVIIVLCLVLLVLVVVAVVYILRQKDGIKVTTRTSVQTPMPTAPIAPQSALYNSGYEPVRPYSPHGPHADPPAASYNEDGQDSLDPLVKRRSSCRGDHPRESDDSQAARVFHNPAYVRNAQPPPSYESALNDISNDTDSPVSNFVPPNDMPTQRHLGDGDATLSSAASGGEATVGGGGGGRAVALSSCSDVVSPSRKMIGLSEDSNNNRSQQGESSGGREDTARAAPSLALVINVHNVNSLHQHNDVNL